MSEESNRLLLKHHLEKLRLPTIRRVCRVLGLKPLAWPSRSAWRS